MLSKISKYMKISTVTACALAAFVPLVLSLAGYLPLPSYMIDTCSQLRILFSLSAIPFIFFALLLRSRVIAGIAGMVILTNGFAFLPLLIPVSSTNTGAKLTLVAANVWGAHNKDFERFFKFIQESNPDVICVEEDTKDWIAKIHEGLPEYRYSFDEGISGGTAIFSKIPIDRVEPPEGKHLKRYGVRGELQIGNQKILLIASHPPAPDNRDKWKTRNLELYRLSDDVRTSEIPVVIAGDFNSTPWSNYFQRMLLRAHLTDSEIGYGIQPSWSTRMPLPLVPIDHCVYTKELGVVKRKVGPNFGSDHLPLVIQLGLKS